MNRSTTTCEAGEGSSEHPCDARVEWNSTPDVPNEKPGASLLKRLGWAVLGVLIVLPIAGAIVAIKVFQFKAMALATANQVVPPQPVNAAEVREEQLQPRVAAVG